MTATTLPAVRQRRYRASLYCHAAAHSAAALRAKSSSPVGQAPVYTRHLCAVLEPGTGRYLGTAVAVLRRDGAEAGK